MRAGTEQTGVIVNNQIHRNILNVGLKATFIFKTATETRGFEELQEARHDATRNVDAAKGTQHQWLLKTHHIKKRHRLTANTGNNTNPGNEIHSFPSGFIRPVANPAMAATAKAIVINTNKIYINFFILPILRFKQKRDYPEKTVPQFIHYNLSASGRDSFKKLIEAFLVEPLGSSSD